MRKHVQILAILNIVWGSFGVFGALIIILVFGGTIGLIGMNTHGDSDAHIAISVISIIGGLILALILLTSIPSLAAGIGLLRLAPWSRILTLVLSVVHLFSIPFGTALGIYGLWVLLSQDTPQLFAVSQRPIRI